MKYNIKYLRNMHVILVDLIVPQAALWRTLSPSALARAGVRYIVPQRVYVGRYREPLVY